MPAVKKPGLLEILPYHFNAVFIFWWVNWSPPFRCFSDEWVKTWGAITLMPSIFDNSQLWHPGALARLLKFQETEGFYFLERLMKKGADANFVMPIFVAYLWNDRVTQTRRNDFIVKQNQEVLRSIVAVKEYYKMFFEIPARMLAETSDASERRKTHRMINIHGGRPEKGFNKVISVMEDKLRGQLALQDAISGRPGKVPADKANRVVFTIHQHILKNTGSPQWEDFWNLLVAAGVLPGGGEKSAKDRQIRPRIESFKRHHPREAKAILERVIP